MGLGFILFPASGTHNIECVAHPLYCRVQEGRKIDKFIPDILYRDFEIYLSVILNNVILMLLFPHIFKWFFDVYIYIYVYVYVYIWKKIIEGQTSGWSTCYGNVLTLNIKMVTFKSKQREEWCRQHCKVSGLCQICTYIDLIALLAMTAA